MNGDILDSRI